VYLLSVVFKPVKSQNLIFGTTIDELKNMVIKKQLIFAVLLFLFIVFVISLCVIHLFPPPPVSENALPSEFSAARAMRHIEAIAQKPHPMGTPEHAVVHDYILRQLKAIGLNPSVQNTFAARHFGDVVFMGEVENIIARLRGIESDGAILLMAHYDTVSTSPGAVDNGSGVAVLLEMMRALQSMEPLKNDVIALFTDGEESALLGSQAFVDENAWMSDIKIALNMGLLYRGPAVIWAMSSENGWLVREWARSVSGSASSSSPFSAFMVGDTDLTPFLKTGITGVHFLTSFSFPYYHTAGDRIEHLSPASIQHIGSQISELVHHVGNLNLENTKAPDRVYFTIMGKTLHYPASWIVPLTVVVSILYFLILVVGIRKKTLRWGEMGIGIFAFLISLVASTSSMTLLFWIIRRTHLEYSLNPHPLVSLWQPHFNGDYLYLIGFIAFTVSIVFASNSLFRKKAGVQALAMGGLFFWLMGAIVLSIVLPSSSYMFHWPLLFTLAAMVLSIIAKSNQEEKTGWKTSLLFILAAVSVLALWVPIIYMFYLWTTFSLLAVLIGSVALVLGAIIPIMELFHFQKRWIVPLIFLTIGVGFIIAGHILAYSEEIIQYTNLVGYWLDGDSGKANWVTSSGKLDQRQIPLFKVSTIVPYSEIHPLGDESKNVLTSPAPVVSLQTPELFVKEDWHQDGKRFLLVHIMSFQQERLEVHLKPEPERLTIYDEKGKEGLPKTFSLIDDGGWAYLRFDALPGGLDLELIVSSNEPVNILLIDVSTGLPSFTGIVTQSSGLVLGSPDCSMSIPTDFTAVHKSIILPIESRTQKY
jgi:hypothetical protein